MLFIVLMISGWGEGHDWHLVGTYAKYPAIYTTVLSKEIVVPSKILVFPTLRNTGTAEGKNNDDNVLSLKKLKRSIDCLQICS